MHKLKLIETNLLDILKAQRSKFPNKYNVGFQNVLILPPQPSLDRGLGEVSASYRLVMLLLSAANTFPAPLRFAGYVSATV